MKTLELLKAVLQTSFNQEVKQLCESYLDVSKLSCCLILCDNVLCMLITIEL